MCRRLLIVCSQEEVQQYYSNEFNGDVETRSILKLMSILRFVVL